MSLVAPGGGPLRYRITTALREGNTVIVGSHLGRDEDGMPVVVDMRGPRVSEIVGTFSIWMLDRQGRLWFPVDLELGSVYSETDITLYFPEVRVGSIIGARADDPLLVSAGGLNVSTCRRMVR